MKTQLSRMIASIFYIGCIPGAPGTYGAIATAIVYWALTRQSHHFSPELHISALCLISIIGVLTAAELARATKVEDPSYVIIDEVAGQLTAYLFLPPSILTIIVGLVAFRVFDIWKPFPIRKLEALENGVGVMADDLLAGVYANIVLQIIYLFL
jgi:phosphatidylglycerophosphatase A